MQLAFPLPHTVRLKATAQAWEAGVTGADQTAMAKRADALGYDMIVVPEHFVVPDAHVALSGPHYFHSFAAMGYLAGATSRIRIGSAISILPLQHPIVTAKALSTIDWLSGGRIFATLAVGWLKGEFDALGVPFHERGRMADEYLAAIVELWTSGSPSFEGRYVRFRDVKFEPKPVQRPHLPIWMGGDSPAALRRAARHACGWITHLTSPEDIAERLDFIRSRPDWRGGPFEVMRALGVGRVGRQHEVLDDPGGRPGMSAQAIVDGLCHLKACGVTVSAVPIPAVADPAAYLDYAQWVIEEIRPRLG